MTTPTYDAFGIRLYTGDSRNVLAGIPDESVQCVITSPPYWGLREYGTVQWEGGDPACDHIQTKNTLNQGFNQRWGNSSGARKQEETRPELYRHTCGKCGAVRTDVEQQIGTETTPTEYIDALMTVFREVKRVLRPDGTVWLNLGDARAGSGYSNHANTGGANREDGGRQRHVGTFRPGNVEKNGGASNRDGVGQVPGLPAKSIVGLPWRVAFALQEDGWILRSDIIWAKPNGMPESVYDRPTLSHEYLFLLVKNNKPLLWRARDTREWSTAPDRTERVLNADRIEVPRWRGYSYYYDGDAIAEPHVSNNLRQYVVGWQERKQRGEAMRRGSTPGKMHHSGGVGYAAEGKNKRTVWTIVPEQYSGAHFATFPTKLVLPCLLAGTRPGDTVLDPFSGTGTTAVVCRRLNRCCIGIDLMPEYTEMAKVRLAPLSRHRLDGTDANFTGELK